MLVILLMLAIGVVALPATAQAAKPPLGLYTCQYPPFFTPHSLKLLKKNRYQVDGTKKSPYKLEKGKVIFRKGAYSDFYARYLPHEASGKQLAIYDKATDYRLWNCYKGKL